MDFRELISHYLRTLQTQGVDCLPVDDGARAILREWMLAARHGGMTAARPLPASVPPPTAPAAALALPEVRPGDSRVPPQVSLMAEIEAEESAESNREADEEEGQPVAFFRPAGNTPQEQWESFASLLPRWKPLRELGTLRETAVPGQGSRSASIMFVGDAPGVQDERAALPFQGEAGAKLDGMLRAMGLTRGDVYMTHLVKFRPAMPRQTLNNRPPTAQEVALSLPILSCEVQLLQPRVIVALGVVAARGLLGCGELPLAACQSIRGQFCNVPVVVTHHPSYLLRTNDMRERRRLWEDMLRVMDMVGLPISEKQRGYFLPKS